MEIFYVIATVVIVAAIFVGWKFFEMNLTVMAITAVVALLMPLPIYAIATTVAKNEKQTYHEYWNGYEVAATFETTTCYRDGACTNEYDCDPYTEVYYVSVPDADGEGSHQEMRTRTVYHDCPYSNEETSYYVDTTLGNYGIAHNLMTGTQFRAGNPIPGGQVTEPPAFWTAAKDRIDSGNPGPVTKVSDYKNYILSSENTLFKRYSDRIDEYLAAGLLPKPSAGVSNFYNASKAYFVGIDAGAVDQDAYTQDVAYLNGAVGSDLRGDLHVVFVDADKAGDPTDYGNSLLAYWQSGDLGRDAIAKNAIIIIVGVGTYDAPEVVTPVEPDVDVTGATAEPTPEPTETVAPVEPEVEEPLFEDGTVIAEWARAFTGMPLGNEAMLTQIENSLKNKALNENFIGRPSYDIASETVKHSDGAIEGILFGVNKFERVSMEATDEDDNGSGFGYLADEWQPDAALMGLIFILSSVMILIVLGIGFAVIVNNDFSDPLDGLVRDTKTNKKGKREKYGLR